MKKKIEIIISIILLFMIIGVSILVNFLNTAYDIAIFKLDVNHDEISNFIPAIVNVPLIPDGYDVSKSNISFPKYEIGEGVNDKEFYFCEDDLLSPLTNISLSTSIYRSMPGPIKRNDIIENKEYNLSNGFSIVFNKNMKLSEYAILIDGEDDIEQTITFEINVRYNSSYKDIEPADDMIYYRYPNNYNSNEYITFMDHSEIKTLEEFMELYPENLESFNNANEDELDNLTKKLDFIYNNYNTYYIIKTDSAIYNIKISKPCNYNSINIDLDRIIDSLD